MHQLLFILSLFFMPFPVKTGTLTIQVTNVEAAEGELSVGLYNSAESFCTDEGFAFAKNFKVNQKGQVTIQFDDIPYGTYAFAMYQDINLNGDIDKNIIGIPKEPYGFSNKARAKWSAPTYEETKFDFNENYKIQNRYSGIRPKHGRL